MAKNPEFKKRLEEAGYKAPRWAGKGHVYGPVVDLSKPCVICGENFPIIEVNLAGDLFSPVVVNCPGPKL